MFIGRLLGFLLGLKLLSLPGAFFGFWVGNLFDKGLKLNIFDIPKSRAASVQQAFFQATFTIMGFLAKADGRVSEYEIRVARQIMDKLGLTEALKLEAIQLFNNGKQGYFDFNNALDLLLRECQYHRDLLYYFIEIQLEAALADGPLQPEEKRILLLICERLRCAPNDFEALWSRQRASQSFHRHYDEQRQHYTATPDSLSDAYAILGVQPNASEAVIKKAYRKLMNQHHPDKLAARGISADMLKMAKEKTQQISGAYNLIRKSKGFR